MKTHAEVWHMYDEEFRAIQGGKYSFLIYNIQVFIFCLMCFPHRCHEFRVVFFGYIIVTKNHGKISVILVFFNVLNVLHVSV